MKAATVNQIKKELQTRSQEELLELCLKLSKFKKENKEYLTYLLYDSDNEQEYIFEVKSEIDVLFQEINRDSFFYIKKSVRKILRLTKKYIRYSKQKETEVELLLYFSHKLINMEPSIKLNLALQNLLIRQIDSLKKLIQQLHEDLQFDYQQDLDKIIDQIK